MTKSTSVLIGCGAIAREHIKALKALGNVTIAAVCDLSAVRAEAIARQYGVEKWFSDYEEMLKAVRPDMVHITTPPASHFPIARRCLEQGLNVLCEKPITIDYAQFEQLKALASSNNCLLLENQNYRFHSSVKRITDLRDTGRLGSVMDVHICIALDITSPGNPFVDLNVSHFSSVLHGGIVGDFLPHIAYLTQMFTGPTIDVHTVWKKHDTNGPFPADEFRGLVRGEQATAYVTFSGNEQPNGFWIKVAGTRMHAEANLFETPRFAARSLRDGERSLATLVDGIAEARDIFRTTVAGFSRKLSGRTSYDGLPDFLSRIYQALQTRGPHAHFHYGDRRLREIGQRFHQQGLLPMKFLVTGAGGFLGTHVVNRLLERGHSVRAVIRPASREPNWSAPVEIFRADLRTHNDLRSAFDGIDAVIHLAAATSGGEDHQFSSTVVATERLLAAMAQSEVKRLIHISSLVVYDWTKATHMLDERTPLLEDAHVMGAYTNAKVWQERIVKRFAADNGVGLTIIRPGFIWGLGSTDIAGMGRHFKKFYVMFGPFTRLPLCHIDNCANCIVAAAEGPSSIGESFNAIDSDDVRVWRYVREYAKGCGQPGYMIPIPYRAGLLTAKLAAFVSRMLYGEGGKLPSLLVPLRYEWQFKPVRFGTQKLRNVLHWTPPLSFEQCAKLSFQPRQSSEMAT